MHAEYKVKWWVVAQLRRNLFVPRLFRDGESPLFLVSFVLTCLVDGNALRNTLVMTAPGDDGVVGEVEHALDGFPGLVSNREGK
jgi:hypothetical protein